MRILILLFLLASGCLASCPTTTLCMDGDSKCFEYVEDEKDFYAAEEACVSKGGHLASISNSFENALVADTAKSMFVGKTDYWIGGNHILTSEWSWTDGEQWSYSNWMGGKPDSLEAVSVMMGSGLWISDPANSAKSFVCEVPKSNSGTTCPAGPVTCPEVPTRPACLTISPHCESGWTLFDETNSCYKVQFNQDFWSAEMSCTKMNAHLVSIHSLEENTFVSNLAYSGEPVDLWHTTYFGMHKANGQWYWTDNSNVSYENWGPNEPHGSGDALIVYVGGFTEGGWYNAWQATPASQVVRKSVCKKPAITN